MAPMIRLRTQRRGGDLHVDSELTEALPPFPSPPQGVDRRKHLPTVEAAILYWDAVSRYAWDVGDDSLLETANGLKKSYEDARAELTKLEEAAPKKPKTTRSSPQVATARLAVLSAGTRYRASRLARSCFDALRYLGCTHFLFTTTGLR